MSPQQAKAPSARSPLRGRRANRVSVQVPEREALMARLRDAARGGAAAVLEDALAEAVWLAPADAVSVAILADLLRALEPVSPTAGLMPLAEGEVQVPRKPSGETLKALAPVALDLIRALGLTPQARAALNIELVPGPSPTADGRHAGYATPSPLPARGKRAPA